MRVGVVGGGMAGLSCGYELQKQGVEVSVFEKENRVGGRAGTRPTAYQPLDLGAQYLNSTYKETRELCEELGVIGQWRSLQPQTHHLYYDGKLHCASYESVLDLLQLGYLSPVARVRLFPFLWRLNQLSRDTSFFLVEANPSLDRFSAYEFAERWGGEELAGRVLDAFVAAYHFHGPEEMSLAFFAAMAGVWKGKFTYDITSEGIGQLAQALARELNVSTNCPVHAVEGNRVVTDRGVEVFDVVVVATTAHTALKLLKQADLRVTEFLEQVRYAATIHAAFACPAAPVRHIAMGVVPKEEGGTVAGFMNQTAKYPEGVRDGKGLMSVFLREEVARKWMDLPDEEVYAFMRTEFLKVCPPLRGEDLIPCDLQRWPYAMPKYAPGYIRKVNKFWDEGQGKNGIFLAGDYLNAPWIEGSIRIGRKVAEEVWITVARTAF